MRLPWLADLLRTTGYPVHELRGWQGRGADLDRVDAVIWHHTATAAHAKDLAVAGILRFGRSDLPGPLAQVGLDRSGGWWVVADGRCNHNGHGTWGNQTIGIEAFHDGDPGTPWPGAQVDSWVKGTAAICRNLGLPVDRVVAHKETDPDRKTDPAGLPMDRMREFVAVDLARPPAEEDDMASILVPTWSPPAARGWTYRLTMKGRRPHVVGQNGAPLNMGVQGDQLVWNVEHVPAYACDLAVAAVGLSPALGLAQHGDRVVVVCEDGGWVDVARRP